MPSMELGADALRNRALNCWPWVRSLTHSPEPVIHSPAEMAAACPTRVTRSRWPRAFTLRTQKPFSALWKVTRSTRPARNSCLGSGRLILDFALLLVLVRRLLNGIVADLRDLSERGHRAVMLIHGSVTIARLGQAKQGKDHRIAALAAPQSGRPKCQPDGTEPPLNQPPVCLKKTLTADSMNASLFGLEHEVALFVGLARLHAHASSLLRRAL
jgi:hypothetical protein